MPSSPNTSDEIAALLAGYARRCDTCRSIVLASDDHCPICIVIALQERVREADNKVQELRKRIAQTKWPEWPKNAKTRWETDTTTGDTT